MPTKPFFCLFLFVHKIEVVTGFFQRQPFLFFSKKFLLLPKILYPVHITKQPFQGNTNYKEIINMAKKNTGLAAAQKMTGEEILITPEMAEQFLLSDMPGNRSINANYIGTMVRDMEKDTWKRSPQPISFDTDGKLIDGRHRLNALVLSQKPQFMFVVRNCPSSCMDHIDCGRKRGLVDRLRIGYPELHWISTKMTSVCNAIQTCWHHIMPTQDEVAQYMITHKESLLWIARSYKATDYGLQKASIRAAIMLAYEGGIRIRLLQDLCDILADPGAVAHSGDLADQNFHQLRNYLMARAIRVNPTGNEGRALLYIVGQAIHDTVQGQKLSNLDKANRFLFPVKGLKNEVVYTPSKFPVKDEKPTKKVKKPSQVVRKAKASS